MLKLLIIKCQCKVIIVTCQWGELWRTRLQGRRGPRNRSPEKIEATITSKPRDACTERLDSNQEFTAAL
jgi:hypothetical protein